MNEETIIDKKVGTEKPQQKKAEKQPSASAATPKADKQPTADAKKKKKMYGTAGIAGAVGVAAGVLTPKFAFAHTNDDGGIIEGSEDVQMDDATMSHHEHLTGHELDVATGVDDSMSFDEAFAAAREEVGAGGLFVWHGHTYGTYYESEWNAMSAEDKDQYWADVHHSTTHINHEVNNPIEPEPPTEPEPPVDPGENGENGENGETGGSGENGEVVNNDLPSDPPGGWNGEGEPPIEEPLVEEPPIEEPLVEEPAVEEPTPEPSTSTVNIDPEDGTLYLNSDEDILGAADIDGDGVADTVIVNANGNDIPDLIIDTDGDGAIDTLAVDVDVQVSVGEVHDINNIAVLNDPSEPVLEPDPTVEPEPDPTAFDPEPGIEDEVLDNPDLDLLSDNTLDPNIPIDNNSDISEFV